MRICANPNCGEPINDKQTHGRHQTCYVYLKRQGRERPLPASTIMRAKNDTAENVALRARHADAYRKAQEDAQDARLQALMPTTKQKAEK